jgi:hypothetical protein
MNEKIMYDKIIKHQTIIDKLITEVLTTREVSSVYWSKMISKIKNEYNIIKAIYKEYAPSIIEKDFLEKLKNTVEKVKSLKTVSTNKLNYAEFKKTDRITNTVNNAKKLTLSDFGLGIDSGIKKMTGTLRKTQQKLITENQINQAIEEGFETTNTWAGSKNRLLLAELEKIQSGKIITITDKNGKQINYDAKKYAELVMRTRMRESETNATIQTGLSLGSDLVQVSSHNTNCDICAEYEGKIYSIGGVSKDFPKLEEEPPFHPNCKHLLIVQFREILEHRGIEQYQAFSNGDIEKPPYIPSYVPLSKRKLS